MILKNFLHRLIEGFLLTLVGFTFFDFLWYGYDVIGALAEGTDWHSVELRLTLNLTRLLGLSIVYSSLLTVCDLLNVRTKGPLIEWIEGRYFGKNVDRSGRR
ncbi:MAG: hypothetical protein IT173_08365 [Acidobacteria bacterium]|nr:hypothetical protein [Acidobacteriota bacterium]